MDGLIRLKYINIRFRFDVVVIVVIRNFICELIYKNVYLYLLDLPLNVCGELCGREPNAIYFLGSLRSYTTSKTPEEDNLLYMIDEPTACGHLP